MKTIRLHPLSLAIGGALALGLSLTLAAAPQTQIPPETVSNRTLSSRPPAVSIVALPAEGTQGSLAAFFRVPREQGVIELGTGWPIPEGMRVTVTGPDRKNGYRIFMTGYLEDA